MPSLVVLRGTLHALANIFRALSGSFRIFAWTQAALTGLVIAAVGCSVFAFPMEPSFATKLEAERWPDHVELWGFTRPAPPVFDDYPMASECSALASAAERRLKRQREHRAQLAAVRRLDNETFRLLVDGARTQERFERAAGLRV